eukprot:3104759-Prymnesium_polylepis.2
MLGLPTDTVSISNTITEKPRLRTRFRKPHCRSNHCLSIVDLQEVDVLVQKQVPPHPVEGDDREAMDAGLMSPRVLRGQLESVQSLAGQLRSSARWREMRQ